MKKTVSRLLALALTAALVLTGCGGGTTTEEPADTSENTGTTESTETTEGETAESNEPGENEITDLVIPNTLTRELETFNWLYSQRAEDSENLTQLVDGLLEVQSRRYTVCLELRKNGAVKTAARPGPLNCAKALNG